MRVLCLFAANENTGNKLLFLTGNRTATLCDSRQESTSFGGKMTPDIWPIAGTGFNILALICFWRCGLGIVGYARWIPRWFPGPYKMTLFILPGIGVACTIVSWFTWRKHRIVSEDRLAKDYANWTSAAMVTGGFVVVSHGWMWVVMRLL